MQYSSTVTIKGQVVIPAQIRNKLGINPSDRVSFCVSGDKIIARKAPSADDVFGFIKTSKKLTDRQLEEAINKSTAEGIAQEA